LADMAKSTQLDTHDPTTYTLLLKPLTIFSQAELQRKSFEEATAIAPDLVPAYFALTTAASKRWGGSHEAALDFARKAMTKAGPGSDMPVCLFWAHSLAQSHFVAFDKDARAAKLYAQNPAVAQELNAALDAWLAPPYVAGRSSIPLLQHASKWYRMVMDADRLRRVIAFTGEQLQLPLPGAPAKPRQTNSPSGSKNGGGLLDWIFGAKR